MYTLLHVCRIHVLIHEISRATSNFSIYTWNFSLTDFYFQLQDLELCLIISLLEIQFLYSYIDLFGMHFLSIHYNHDSTKL